jgi:hypothetical protein
MRLLGAALVLLCAVPSLADDWKEVSDEAFTARLPGDWKVEDQLVDTEAGKVNTRSWSSELGERFVTITTVTYPPDLVRRAVPSKMLEGARDGALANINATLEKDFPVFVDSGVAKKKWPGRDIFATTPQGLRYAGRLILADNVLYQLIVIRPAAEGTDDEFRALVQGFKLKPQKRPPAKR